jgi:G3E family GTPase
VTIVTGFLGAGKTTLLNHLISELPQKRVCIFENEFGLEIGLENTLVIGGSVEEVVDFRELGGGCACCSVRYACCNLL